MTTGRARNNEQRLIEGAFVSRPQCIKKQGRQIAAADAYFERIWKADITGCRRDLGSYHGQVNKAFEFETLKAFPGH